ncbi:MAG: hypothetical protein LBH14_04605, partial [Desulfobulbaceae bacterium]|jgi:3-deoxy-D-manno-octulosonic-acid transferase|nr:hypothetical protein [Desulfobulbaceae bacterium]
LGNLKYAAGQTPAQTPISNQALATLLPPGKSLWVCGSTHAGEEEIIFAAYDQLRARCPDVFLLLAPRRPERGEELVSLANKCGLTARLRSQQGLLQILSESSGNNPPCDLLILDSIGELASCYSLAAVAFIGGSLVAEGGHNPLEAAWAGKAILFGRHMEDFSEIAADLIATGAARVVADAAELMAALTEIFTDTATGEKMGAAALALTTARRQGVLAGHLQAIAQLLAAK